MKRIFTILLLLVLLSPIVIFAQQGGVNGGNGGGVNGGAGGGINGASNGTGNVTLNNPLGQGTTLTGFIQEILDVILIFAVPLIVFFIILAGFNYVMARGNPGKVQEASKALLYAVIGGVIILGAYVILEVISGTIDAFR